jgi:hypothetical protein
MALEALKELDEKFECAQQHKAKNLKEVAELLQTFTININGTEIEARMCPSAIEKEMMDDLQNKNISHLEYAKKYFPIWFGIEPNEVEQFSSITILELIKAYIEKYAALINRNFRNNGDVPK